MNKRIQLLRNTLELTAHDFGQKVNLSALTVKTLESNSMPVSPSIISKICSAFSVNENWLKYGEGEIFAEKVESPFTPLREFYQLSEEDEELIKSFVTMPPVKRKALYDLIKLFESDK